MTINLLYMYNPSIHTFTKINWNFFQDHYTRPISNSVPVMQEVNEINTVIKPEKDEVQCSSTYHVYQIIQKKLPREKVWTIPFLLESPKNKEFQPRDLVIDFLIEQNQISLKSPIGM